ncbi:metal dependent phosphohydrolase [Chloroherpeton thalassium ATCC 35110]|uniref:Metal dependent phosphohydrolase n=1 Tax=Chloroherpeton thalassium (strain ATCC 35110 / GB-78) TaxID=517418 RepID=B3QV38_CHLT3|nr:HD domain-containing protein [Chloroherpeton thalassium]ACF12992.1 metal dependent phosphohydrolase [Chloroherpeton thalassium ATCC 35110]
MQNPIDAHFLFRSDGGFIRMPVWGHIPLIQPLKKIISHPAFLRLKGIRQLSFAHHVFPGATHTRFEHSIGVYHLMKLILQRVVTNPLTASHQTETFCFDENTCRLLLAASLLHDIGHYPHAHALESAALKLNGALVFEHHEKLTEARLYESHQGFGSLAGILKEEWKVEPEQVIALISGKTASPFSKLISGTLDPDKMDYLMRDAHHCNIPYGNIDIERLIESFVPDAERRRFAITEKGIAPLESLMFAKYMMMRNVYWHHTVRTLSAMLRRAVQDILGGKHLSVQECQHIFYHNADERVLYDLRERVAIAKCKSAELLDRLVERQSYKRAMTIGLQEAGAIANMPNLLSRIYAISEDAELCKQKEIEICEMMNHKFQLKLHGHEILIDAPSNKHIFDYQDFRELHIFRGDTSGNKGVFLPFDKSGESVFESRFILEFEKYTKKLRIVSRPEIATHLRNLKREVLEILYS